MKTEILPIDPDNPSHTLIAKAAKTVEAGGLVVFPTETVYGIACAARSDAIGRLDQIKQREEGKRYTLHIGDRQQAAQYVPSMGYRAKKIMDSLWPGPLTIVFELDPGVIEMQRNFVGPEAFELLYRDNSIGIRCVHHPVAGPLLQQTTSPVFAPSANPGGQPPAVDAQKAIEYFDGKVDTILDAGPCIHSLNSTVIRLSGADKEIDILRSGAIPDEKIREISTIRILFVCTGNTCRSPMAEAIARNYVAEKLHCDVDALEKLGYKIVSAGVSAIAGVPASDPAVEVCRGRGIDIRGHRSSPLDCEKAREADFVFALARGHRQAVLDECDVEAQRCILLDETGDIPDPIGGDIQTYEQCAQRIETAVKKQLDGILA